MGAPQERLGLLKMPQLVINPAQTVQDGGVARRDDQGALYQLGRLFKSLRMVG